jgi:hypothetical protein
MERASRQRFRAELDELARRNVSISRAQRIWQGQARMHLRMEQNYAAAGMIAEAEEEARLADEVIEVGHQRFPDPRRGRVPEEVTDTLLEDIGRDDLTEQ